MSKADDQDRQEVLRLTYDEIRERVGQQRDELQNQRETALRTLRATVILIGVLITFSDAFRQPLAFIAGQEFVFSISNILGGAFVGISGVLLFLSPILAVWSLILGHLSGGIEPMDLRALADGKLDAELNGEIHHPSHNSGDWFQYMIHKHSGTISDNDYVLQQSELFLRFSHTALAISPILLVLGIWLSDISV